MPGENHILAFSLPDGAIPRHIKQERNTHLTPRSCDVFLVRRGDVPVPKQPEKEEEDVKRGAIPEVSIGADEGGNAAVSVGRMQ